MDRSLFTRIDASIISLVLLVLMLATVVVGHKSRKWFWGPEDGDTRGGIKALLGALFGLWGFMLAFTFSQSGNRLESVRAMIVDEANLLRTAIIKADLFPDSVRNIYRTELHKYLEERISYYDDAADFVKADINRQEISRTAVALWAITADQSKKTNMNGPVNSMIESLTAMFDIGIRREALLSAGIPNPITYILIILALAICFVGGFTTPVINRKEWIVVTVFAILASTILFITIDLARPMRGLIRADAGEVALTRLRDFF